MRSVAFRATFWSAADVFLRQGVQFGISIALARLLTPADFGTVSLLYLFAGVAGTFATGGLTTALIQARDVTREDESTVFWFNLGVGMVMGVLFWFCGPLIARLYEIPVLEPLSTVMAITVVVTAASGIQQALLTKQLNFRPLMVASVLAAIVSGVVAIWLAWRGEGVWALAAQSLVSATATTAVLWVVSPWRPKFTFSLASARRLFGFGGYMLASSLLEVVYSRLYTLLIGKLYGARELGLYARAETTAQLPSTMLNLVVGRVALPMFSRVSHDTQQLRTDLASSLRTTMFFYMPAMLGIAALAEPLVRLLFGAAWLPCVPYFQILCLAGAFMPFHILNLQALTGLGRSDLYFRLELLKKLMVITIVCIAALFGVTAMAWGVVIGHIVMFVINTHYSKRLLNYGALAQVNEVKAILVISGVMAILAALAVSFLSLPDYAKLVVLPLAGAAFYLGSMVTLKDPTMNSISQHLAIRNG